MAAIALAAAAGAGAIGVARWSNQQTPAPAARAPADRPALALLTSLPLMFGESFAIDSGGSPALSRLEQRYNIQPIGVADAASLAGQRLLLMAHARAQPAEALADLDAWVRSGGRLVLLADPRLDWESARPLGDRLRPPPDFADTNLLGHWGLALSGPKAIGPASAGNGDIVIQASSPGVLESRGGCRIAGGGFVARCRIGKGAAIVIADADFLNVGPDEAATPNLDLLLAELDRAESF